MLFKTIHRLILLFFLFIFIESVNSYLILCQNGQPWSPQSQLLNKRQLFVWTRLGYPMIVDNYDLTVSLFIKKTGIWQGGIANFIKHLVKPGDKVLNLGSQSGMQVLALGKIIGQSGHLYIFQPYSFSYRIMRKSIFLNKLQNISTTYNIGASNKFEMGKLIIDYTNTGKAKVQNKQSYIQEKMKNFGIASSISNQQIVLARVDQVFSQDIILDFALIDVQSMQIEALDGMKKIIQRSPNLIIFTQWQYGLFQAQKSRQLFDKVVAFLFSKKYKIYQVLPNMNCQIPTFLEKNSISSLIIKDDVNLVMIPEGKQLPRY